MSSISPLFRFIISFDSYLVFCDFAGDRDGDEEEVIDEADDPHLQVAIASIDSLLARLQSPLTKIILDYQFQLAKSKYNL